MASEGVSPIEIAISVVGVGGFIAAVVYVGLAYGDGGLTQTGAIALVGLIAAFILVMTAAGYWLSARDA